LIEQINVLGRSMPFSTTLGIWTAGINLLISITFV